MFPIGKVFKVKNEIGYVPEGMNKKTVFEQPGFEAVLIALDPGAVIPDHEAPGNVFVIALEGKAEINYNGELFHIKKGENIVFEKGVTHSVKALSPYKMALLIAK